jgi:hypothetical protein
LLYGCTEERESKPIDAQNLIPVSENVFFNNLTKRYVFSAEESSTRSEELTQAYEAILQ